MASKEIMMTTKDVSIQFHYSKRVDYYTSTFNKYNPDYEYPRGKEYRRGRKWLLITLNKNKKIDPAIIYDIYENRNNLDNSLYRGNIHYSIHDYYKTRYVNYWTDFEGVILEICGSRTGKYDYSLDDLPADLPITELHISLTDYKYSFNKFPDTIKKIKFRGLNYSNVVNYLPKSLKSIEVGCNINLSNLPFDHPQPINLLILAKTFDSINYLPVSYISKIITHQKYPEITNLPYNLEWLNIGSESTKLLDFPESLKYLYFSIYHPEYDKITDQLTHQNRIHILDDNTSLWIRKNRYLNLYP